MSIVDIGLCLSVCYASMCIITYSSDGIRERGVQVKTIGSMIRQTVKKHRITN